MQREREKRWQAPQQSTLMKKNEGLSGPATDHSLTHIHTHRKFHTHSHLSLHSSILDTKFMKRASTPTPHSSHCYA